MQLGVGSYGALVTPNVTRVITETQYKGEGSAGSIQYYCTLLNNTLKVQQHLATLGERVRLKHMEFI